MQILHLGFQTTQFNAVKIQYHYFQFCTFMNYELSLLTPTVPDVQLVGTAQKTV